MKTLDKTKPYGEIMGVLSSAPRARYEQDGVLYDVNGLCLEVVQEDPVEEEKPKRSYRKRVVETD